MKKSYSWKNILRNSFGFIALLIVSMACFKDSKYENNSTPPRTTPTENKVTNSNDKSPTPSPSASATMSTTTNTNNSTTVKSQSYQDNLPAGFRVPTDSVGKRILSDYGAVYVARNGVTPPPTAIFESDDECAKWQSGLKTSRASVGGTTLELQEAAMKDLQAAITEAQSAGVTISPNGDDSARRSYSDTIRLWASRVNPALEHWVGKGKITKDEAARIKALSPTAQVPEVLKLEEQGIYFDKYFAKSILYSVAAPGASQHLSMLALDVKEHANPKVREILAKHNWYQTVSSDTPHFTYLGVAESELPKLGLKNITNDGRSFWVPSL
jgi:LAS superfamily LD-carboxypeptidase LdcB